MTEWGGILSTCKKQKQLYTSIPFEDHILEIQKGVGDIQFQELHRSHKSQVILNATLSKNLHQSESAQR